MGNHSPLQGIKGDGVPFAWPLMEEKMQTETKAPDKKEKKTLGAEILDWVKTIAIALAVAFIIRTFVVSFVHVSGNSMLETLKDGDIMLVSMFDRYIGEYERGEVVICNYPNAKGYRVKRVVGLPGDTVEVRDKVTYVNGEAVEEPFVEHPARTNYGPITLEEGEYFLMGDNRASSKDSRHSDVGPIAEKEIVGVVRAVIYPFNAIRMVK